MTGSQIALGPGWRIVAGAARSAVEDTAVRDLQEFLRRRLGAAVPVVTEDGARGAEEIVVGTPASCALLKEACAAGRLAVTGDHPGAEGFQLKVEAGRLILVCGADGVGALYGVFYLQDRIGDGQLTADLDLVRRPFFQQRSGGAQWSQQMPAHYGQEQLAAWLAHHHLNLYGPIIQPWCPEAVLGDGLAQAWGIGASVCVEPPRPTPEFIQAHPEYVHYDRRGAVQWGPSPTMCFRCEASQGLFAEWIRKTVERYPRAKQLTVYFGDLACICADSCPHCGATPYPARAVEILEFLRREAQAVNPQVKLIGQTWLLHGEREVQQIVERAPTGVGIQMNEPALAELVQEPGFGSQDNWLVTFELDETFGPVYLNAARSRGQDFYPLMSIGDSCESVDPVIGMQLPWTVARKVRRAAEHGMTNLCIWWGLHPWVYSANYEVIREMVFEPFQDIDSLIAHIARRDFGAETHGEALETWRWVEEAMRSWAPKVSWMERLEEYTGRCTRSAFFIPLTESLMEQDWSQRSNDWTLSMSKSDKVDWWAYRNAETLVRVREGMCRQLREALAHARRARDLAEREGQVRARQQLHWLELLSCLFLSQGHYFKTLEFEKLGLDDDGARERWIEVVEGEVANCERVLEVVDALGPEISNLSGLNRTMAQDRLQLVLKIKQMRHGISPAGIGATLSHKARRLEEILSVCRPEGDEG